MKSYIRAPQQLWSIDTPIHTEIFISMSFEEKDAFTRRHGRNFLNNR